MKRRSALFALALCAAARAAAAQAPPPRPVPNPVQPPRGYLQALARGTRTAAGMPGPRYWQQWADYRIRATVDPAAKTLAGSETVTYHNRSPDTLRVVVLKVYQNVHQAEAVATSRPRSPAGWSSPAWPSTAPRSPRRRGAAPVTS
jgi:hypothetical protein